MGLEERSQRKNEKGRTWRKYQRAEGLHSDRRGIVQEAAWRILSRCINEKEGKLRLEELHTQACGITEKISLYRRMQRMGYCWTSMNKEAATIQKKCQECQLAIDKEKSYAMFVTEDWRISFIEYLA